MPLSLAPEGQTFTVKKISGDPKVVKHLASLGIAGERKITVMSQGKNGTVVMVGDSRLALDRDIAKSILVF